MIVDGRACADRQPHWRASPVLRARTEGSGGFEGGGHKKFGVLRHWRVEQRCDPGAARRNLLAAPACRPSRQLPLGRAMLATKPLPTGSATFAKMKGGASQEGQFNAQCSHGRPPSLAAPRQRSAIRWWGPATSSASSCHPLARWIGFRWRIGPTLRRETHRFVRAHFLPGTFTTLGMRRFRYCDC
jgi:hypothetical protein